MFFKNNAVGYSLVAQCTKLLPAMLAFHTAAAVPVPAAPSLIPFPAKVLGKAAEDGPTARISVTHVRDSGEALDSWFQLLRSCRGTNQQMQQLFLLSPDCHCSFQIKTCGFLFVWRTSTVLQVLLFIEPFPSTNKKMRFHGLQVASHSPTSCWTHREAPPTALATGRGQRKAGWGPSLCHSRPSRGKNSPEEKNRFLT